MPRGRFTWTAAETESLRLAYEIAGSGNVGLADLAARLGRFQSNVSRQARKMGLTRRGRPQPDSARARISARALERASDGRGPKPTTGIRPSEATRAKMRAAHRRLVAEGRHPGQLPRSDATRQKMSKLLTERLMTGGNVYSRCRHGKRDDLGGQFFRSAWEANYARYLNLLKSSGRIRDWEYEPETFWFEDIKRGVRSYLPDFRVTNLNGSTYLVEVKGWMDAKSVTKLKRMKKYYPEMELRVVEQRSYREIEAKLGKAIRGWEF